MPDIKLFAGNATPELAKRISERLYISLGDATVARFSDGEIQVQINENVRVRMNLQSNQLVRRLMIT